MSDYSSVGPPQAQNFNQSTAFAAALQRAKQVSVTHQKYIYVYFINVYVRKNPQ